MSQGIKTTRRLISGRFVPPGLVIILVSLILILVSLITST